MASSRYMSSMSWPSMPTAAAISGSGSRPLRTSRMNERMATSLRRTFSTTAVSPAVNSSARYSNGMRMVEMAV
ncbi:hypothetical protein WU86_10335 [Corynebacterium xerosis]|nr:hypothetical protein WU86_10335 [Corynebacterium xerosis]